MAPDVPYFFSMGDLRGATHGPVGIVTIDLALGIGLFAAFHLVWKRPLVALAPEWARRRLAGPAGGFRRSMILWVPPSLLAGTVTHVLWDAFTHRYHGFGEYMPWLPTTSFAGLETFRWLQYGSGLGGVAIIAWWCRRWIRRAPTTPQRQGAAHTPYTEAARWSVPRGNALGWWACLIASGAAGGVIGALTLINQPDLPRTIHMTLASGVIGTICGGIITLTVFGFLLLLRERPGLAEGENPMLVGPVPGSDMETGPDGRRPE